MWLWGMVVGQRVATGYRTHGIEKRWGARYDGALIGKRWGARYEGALPAQYPKHSKAQGVSIELGLSVGSVYGVGFRFRVS